MTRSAATTPTGGPPSALARSFDPRRAVAGLAAFAGLGVGLSALYATTGVGAPCPLRLVTGWACPLCGGTRLGSALLHGDLGAAFAANPLVLVGLVVLTALGVAWLVELAGGPRVRPPARVRSASAAITPTAWTLGALGLGAAYTVARHLWFPV